MKIDNLMDENLKYFENLEILGKYFFNSKLKLIDFGFSRLLEKNEDCYTFVGSPRYLPNKILFKQSYCYEIDFYSIGILTFHLLTGKFPFNGENMNDLEELIKKGSYSIEENCVLSIEILTFITRLLNLIYQDIEKLDFFTKSSDQFSYFKIEDCLTLNTSDTHLFLKSLYDIPPYQSSEKNYIINYLKIIDYYFI